MVTYICIMLNNNQQSIFDMEIVSEFDEKILNIKQVDFFFSQVVQIYIPEFLNAKKIFLLNCKIRVFFDFFLIETFQDFNFEL